MNKQLVTQIVVLGLIAVVIGVLNNLRPDAKIPWVRDWADYSDIMGEEPEPEPESEAAPEAPEETPTESPDEAAARVSEMVASNVGITDIGLKEAFDIFTYASEFTFWIDARDADLYAEGHIQGAKLLYYYEMNSYLPDIQMQIDEMQPAALVVYCKGKECTDSHHLAQDLTGFGYSNIFVYKDGFDDWYKAGHPIEGNLEQVQAEPVAEAPADAFDHEKAGQVAEMVANNIGITDIGLTQAYEIWTYARDFTFWIDARDAEMYAEGHVQGAKHLDYYQQNSYMPDIQAQIDEMQPAALVIYCKGKDCTDSHHLAQDMTALGYSNIFVYKDGFNDWYEAGYAIEGTLADAPAQVVATGEGVAADTATVQRRVLPEEKPPGMYLEHVLRDLIPFFFGLILLAMWNKAGDHLKIGASIFVGLFFIWAAWPKLVGPLEFAKNIWQYDIAPAYMINFSALVLPSLELVAGLALITGLMRRGAGAWVSLLLVIFIAAVGFNVIRGHEFNCGCTATTTLFTDAYLEGWNDKYMLILRDIGLLVMSAMAMTLPSWSFKKKGAP